jgi:hypothetical protein
MVRVGLALLVAVTILAAIIPFVISKVATQAAAVQPLVVYKGSLSSSWQSWSWGSSINFKNTSPVYSGNQYSISVTGKNGWSGLALHVGKAINISQYTSLSFVAYASKPGLHYAVGLYDQNQHLIRPVVPLTRYGGDPVSGSWTSYTIPLGDLAGQRQQVSEILIQNATSQKQAAAYFDAIQLLPGIQSVTPSPTPSPTSSASNSPIVNQQSGGNAYFSLLPVGSALPSDQECAARVRYSSWEPRSDNYKANHTLPTSFTIDMSKFGPISQQAKTQLLPRIDGNFTGTTDEILQWAACKWGFDENILRAQAVQESDWHQSHVGDNGASYGIMQVKRTYVPFTYPNSMNSTAFNVDYMMAIRRICFEGGILFLKNGYHAGDEWGCVGNWFSGAWMDSGAKDYISKVKARLQNQDWNHYGAGPVPMPGNPIAPSMHTDATIPANHTPNAQQLTFIADVRHL